MRGNWIPAVFVSDWWYTVPAFTYFIYMLQIFVYHIKTSVCYICRMASFGNSHVNTGMYRWSAIYSYSFAIFSFITVLHLFLKFCRFFDQPLISPLIKTNTVNLPMIKQILPDLPRMDCMFSHQMSYHSLRWDAYIYEYKNPLYTAIWKHHESALQQIPKFIMSFSRPVHYIQRAMEKGLPPNWIMVFSICHRFSSPSIHQQSFFLEFFSELKNGDVNNYGQKFAWQIWK